MLRSPRRLQLEREPVLEEHVVLVRLGVQLGERRERFGPQVRAEADPYGVVYQTASTWEGSHGSTS